jgi:hypothetical protein
MSKRPVAFRVPRLDPATGGQTISKTEWRLFTSEEAANEAATALGLDYQGLYVRDGSEWECMGRKQSLPEPGECNWPDCGCDIHATKVIETLIEQGWTPPTKRETA